MPSHPRETRQENGDCVIRGGIRGLLEAVAVVQKLNCQNVLLLLLHVVYSTYLGATLPCLFYLGIKLSFL